jgi:predicted CoA-substrate-specific enzyme activase
VRTVIDVGGQDAKAIKLDDQGRVIRFIYNDKCAAGTGRFLEVMAEALDVDLGDMAELSGRSTQRLPISSQCVVFAETEIISLINAGLPLPDIISGLHRAMADRVASLARSIEVVPDVALTGGVAKNLGLARALAEALGVGLTPLKFDPQLNGALGAALFAGEAIVS